MFYIGLHSSGACKIGNSYNTNHDKNTDFVIKPLNYVKIFGEMYFNDIVLDKDVKTINIENEGVIYHINVFNNNNQRGLISNNINQNQKNDYTLKYFPQVLTELKKRKLDFLIDIKGIILHERTVADHWTDYDSVYHSRESQESMFPKFNKIIKN